MTAFDRAWWLRQAIIIAISEVLGYLLSVELRDRYPQEICFFAVFCMITAVDELHARRKLQRTREGMPDSQTQPFPTCTVAAAQRETLIAAKPGAPNVGPAWLETQDGSTAWHEAPNTAACAKLNPAVIPLRPPGA